MIQPKERESLPPNFGPDQVSDSTSPRWTEVVDHLKGIVIASNVPKGQVSLKKRKEKMEEKKAGRMREREEQDQYLALHLHAPFRPIVAKKKIRFHLARNTEFSILHERLRGKKPFPN